MKKDILVIRLNKDFKDVVPEERDRIIHTLESRLNENFTVLVLTNENETNRTEFEIIKVLMQNPGFVITRDELAEKALGYGSASAGRTLDSHIKNLRRKIDRDSSQESFIQTVHGIGYRMRDQ